MSHKLPIAAAVALLVFLCVAGSASAAWTRTAFASGAGTPINPRIAVDDVGNSVAVWTVREATMASPRVQVRMRSAAGVRGSTMAISPSAENAAFPDAGLD